MYTYDTVVAALNGLKERGFNLNFNIAFDKLICLENDEVRLDPADFEIVEVYRFEGNTNPSDEDVVYALEAKKGEIKGVLTSAYGAYADTLSPELLRKLSMHTGN